MIHPERILHLKPGPACPGKYVLYWMQQAQRAHCNHALEYAIEQANDLRLPLLVGFGLTAGFPEARRAHYRFMLEGLREVEGELEKRRIRFVLRLGEPDRVALDLARDAAVLIADRGYLRIQKQWRQRVAAEAPCPVTQVETDAIVPVETASEKEEYSAATLRRKIHRVLERYLVSCEPVPSAWDGMAPQVDSLDLQDVDRILQALDVPGADIAIQPPGGTPAAHNRLRHFLAGPLSDYPAKCNEPDLDIRSGMSAYLHFGQISPLDVALQVRAAQSAAEEGRAAYLEELIVRRELAMNFVHYNPAYDRYDALPEWARKTLDEHRGDPRPYLCDREQLERAQTHDPYWNAAQQELLLTGRIHGYMRMYWGKKILEWSSTPEEAFATALTLNNTGELDGRDPNGFAGVAWCFGKHDRAWPERPIFGKVRYMNDNGLRRKFNMPAYLDRVRMLAQERD